ncbi:MAG: NBR1-Ig-like domain-containing protein [Thermoanaerobaculia bacterium]
MRRLLRAGAVFAAALLAAAPPGRAAASEASPYGVNAHAPGGDDLRLLLDRAQEARLGWVRIDFLWSSVEPSRGKRDWALYDEIVREARARGVEVYASLGGTPAWATDGPAGSGVPRDVADWRAFVSESARRYRGRVKAWGVWNEPNLSGFWAGTRAQYLDLLLRPAAEEIRKADPDALVCGPELAHLTSGGASWYDWLLESMRRARDVIDVVTHHVYDRDGSGGVTRKLDASTTFGGDPRFWDLVAPSVREVLRYAGADDKPVWLTETGWASDEVGEAAQSTFLVGLLGDWFGRAGEPSWVKKVFVYELVDDGSAGVPKWGLLRPDRTPKAAFTGLSTFTSAYPPYGDAASLVSAVVPGQVAPGVAVPVTVTLRNTGRATWTREAGYALAPLADAALLAPGRVPLPSSRSVATGETATFSFPMTAPRDGTFGPEWRLVTEEGTPFGPAIARTVTASGGCAAPAAPVVTAAPGGSVSAGALALFAWGAGDPSARYRVQAGTLPPSGEPAVLVDREVAGPPFAWSVDLGAGATAAFRVAAVNACGAAGPYSALTTFRVVAPPAAVVPTRGQGVPWLVRAGETAPTALLAFRNVGGTAAAVRFESTESAFAVTPLSATLAPGEEATLLLSARPGATTTPGVRAGRVVATWGGGVASTPVAMAVASGGTGSARVSVSPPELLLLAPAGQPTVSAEVVVTNPGPAPVLLAPVIDPGGGWLSVAAADLATPIPAKGTRRLRLTADRRLRTAEDGASPVRTLLSLVAAGGEEDDRVDVPVVDAVPAPRGPAPGRGPVPAGTASWVVPTAVRMAGALGQAFSSSLVLRNHADAPAAVAVYATPAGADGERDAVRAVVEVPPNGSLLFDDALPVLFGDTDVAVHLEVRGPPTLAVRSVVTGTSPAGGRFTAEVPAVAAGEGTGAGRRPLLLPGLKVTNAVRCNVVLAETAGRSARVALRLFDSSGRPLGRGEVAVPAWGSAQLALASAVGLPGPVPEASSLRVEPLEGDGRVVALATLVDNVSASFSVVTGRPAPQDASDGAGPQVVASIVQAAGKGAYFTTELSVATAAPSAAPLKLTYAFAGTNADGAPIRGSVERESLLPRDGALPIDVGRNVVLSLFARGPATNTSGSLRIEGDGAGRVLARAAVSTPLDLADTSRGTMTAELPAVGPASPEVVGAGLPAAVLPGLRSWRRERVNLIVTEVTGAPARVVLRLSADGDVPRGERELLVGPFEKAQLDDLWNGPSGFGLGPAPVDRLVLAAHGTGTEGGRVVVAATTVDNATNGVRIQLLAPPGPAPLAGPSGR